MNAINQEIQQRTTPHEVYKRLQQGNERFLKNKQAQRDWLAQVEETGGGQYPLAAVLGCIDSRVPVEVVFDQGIGDIFCARVAGNIVNEDILGSLEYACKVAGAKLILVLGHTRCGAVTAACKNVELGNITPLLKKIKPAINALGHDNSELTDSQIEDVTVQNIRQSISNLRSKSPILKELADKGEILIRGAVYDVTTGEVDFL